MTKRILLGTAALACVCMLPFGSAAHADDFDLSAPAAPTAGASTGFDNEISEAVDFVSKKNAVFGRYNGLTNDGFGVMGSANLNSRDAWNSGDTSYFHLDADKINFGQGMYVPEGSLNMKAGEQGTWGAYLNYDAMTYTASDHFTTIFNKNGSLDNALTNAINTGSTRNVTTASLNEIVDNVGTRRDKNTVGGNYNFGHWLFTSSFSEEHKEGTLEQSMTTAGSNSGFVTFPMPVNYDTENFRAAAAYNTQQLQAKLTYNFSNFTDNNSGGFAFQGWNTKTVSGTVYPMSGIYSLPPGNQEHAVTGEVGYNVAPATRLNGTFKYGLQLQNDPFVAATGNTYTLSHYSSLLNSNPSSLNGFVNTFFGNAGVTSRPIDKLSLKANYTADIRDPQTNAMWIYGDPTDTAATTSASTLKYRQAVPEGWTKQAIALEAGYHILPSTRATLGYAFRDNQRANAITHETQENEGSAKLNTTFTPNLTGSLGFVHNDRTASAPDFSMWTVQIPSDCFSSSTGIGCQQVPFYEAARTEDAITTNLMGTIDADTSANLFVKFANDQYHNGNVVYNNVLNPSVGINDDYNIQVAPSVNYRLSEQVETHIFYTFLRDYRTMRALNSNNSNVTQSGLGYYTETTVYDIHTAGLGGNWHMTDKLKLGADYTVSYGNQWFNQYGSWDNNQAGQTFGGDPHLNAGSMDHVVRLNASYDYTPDAQFFAGYQFDSLSMTDWALTGASVGQVLTGNLPAKYNVSTVMTGVKIKF